MAMTELEKRLRDAGSAARSSDSRWAVGALGADAAAAEQAIAGLLGQRPVMLFVADLVEGRFLWINQTVGEVLGVSVRELLEGSFLDRVHPEDLSRTVREMERLLAGQPTIDFRNRHRHADGSYRVFEWAAIADSEGELCYAMAIEAIE